MGTIASHALKSANDSAAAICQPLAHGCRAGRSLPPRMTIHVLLPGLVAALAAGSLVQARAAEDFVNRYRPVEGGWEIQISADPSATERAAGLGIGGVEGVARLHRRPASRSTSRRAGRSSRA